MSIAVAVHDMNSFKQMNLSLVLCELDKDYYDSGLKRYQNHIKQKTIFSCRNLKNDILEGFEVKDDQL